LDINGTDTDATKLLGLEGMGVIGVEVDAGGAAVHVATTDPAARGCPVCGVISTARKDRRVTRPRRLPCGGQTVAIRWHKWRWHLAPHRTRLPAPLVHRADPPGSRRGAAGPRTAHGGRAGGGRRRTHRRPGGP
jgi:hypothetical protein